MTSQQTTDLQRKLSKEEINALPLISYDGPIHLIDTKKDALIAAKKLQGERILGFDTEKRPSFRKGEAYPPSLLQLADADAVYIFQLQLTGVPPELLTLLTDKNTVKAGVAVSRDIQELQDMKQFTPAGFTDLGDRARDAGIKHHGLRGLAAVLLGGRISKGAKLTNWSRTDLSKAALTYAATDAWIGRCLYQVMKDAGIAV